MDNIKQKAKLTFIVSLPRSGSTLLQRILSTHPSTESFAESWLFLHLLNWRSEIDVETEYDFRASKIALSEFFDDKKWEAFCSSLNIMVAKFTADPNKMFVDKTPRYSLILPQLKEVFPDAKIILLFRNPIVVANSMVDAWGDKGKRWRMRPYFIDLYKGFPRMVDFARENIDNPNVMVLRYEDLVSDPKLTSGKIVDFLNLEKNSIDIDNISKINLSGTMGDKVGIKKYSKVTNQSISNIEHMCNFKRRLWAKSYINWLGKANLSFAGYNDMQLLNLLDNNNKQKYIFRDCYESVFQFIKLLVNVRRFSVLEKRSEIMRLSELS